MLTGIFLLSSLLLVNVSDEEIEVYELHFQDDKMFIVFSLKKHSALLNTKLSKTRRKITLVAMKNGHLQVRN